MAILLNSYIWYSYAKLICIVFKYLKIVLQLIVYVIFCSEVVYLANDLSREDIT